MKESPHKQHHNHHNQRGKSSPTENAFVYDLITTCPRCGGEIGLWSEEPETLCVFCQYRLFDREKTVH